MSAIPGTLTKKPRAMVFEAPGKPLALREFARPTLAAGEMLVEVSCTTLCGSDLHSYEGRRPTPCPTILGHEILGRVCELRPGDPVARAPTRRAIENLRSVGQCIHGRGRTLLRASRGDDHAQAEGEGRSPKMLE